MSISNGQVLFATDVEEFRNLAKKLVPENIADKLVEIVSKSKYNHNNNNDNEYQLYNVDSKQEDEYYYDGYDYEEKDAEPSLYEQHPDKPVSRQGKNAPDAEQLYHKPTEPMEVNLDDLVEKVRERLLDDFQKNPAELQKLLGSKSVIAKLKNESNHFFYTKKLKLLRDRHGQKHNQQFRPVTGQKVSRPQLINIERKDSRYNRPGLRFSRPLSSNIQEKDEQVQVYEDDNLPSRYRPRQKISRPQTINKEIKGVQGQGYEEDDLLTQYSPGKIISKPQTSNKEIKGMQEQAYEEEDLLTRYRPGKINSSPQSSNKESNDAKPQAFVEDVLPEIDKEGNIRVPKEQRQKNQPEFIFQEFDLNFKKNEKDTYEDYVTPKKEDNVFVSEESETTNNQAKSSPRSSHQTKKTQNLDIFDFKLQNGIKAPSQASERTNPQDTLSSTSPSIFDESNETYTEPDMKARTENLWFDYKDEPIEKIMHKNAEASAKGETKQVKLGTMIPTRETYKMTSPNYYGQLPTVAEKYNFDEPIPEKDREREDLKPIGNPPANINGKIRV